MYKFCICIVIIIIIEEKKDEGNDFLFLVFTTRKECAHIHTHEILDNAG